MSGFRHGGIKIKLRPSGMPNPALPEGGSTGAGNSNASVTPTPVATVCLRIRSSCTGGSSSLPTSVLGTGPSGAAEALVKELLSVHPDPQSESPIRVDNRELKNWLKAVTSGVGSCIGMIEIDTGEAAGRPCTLCGESTSNNNVITSGVKRPNNRPEPASSTTGAPPPPSPATPPADWSVEDVIGFIAAADPALAAHADLFRKHEIDGKALLLLNSDMMMKYMGLKLGPALKICNLVSKIKNRRHYST
nr:unnamed protein product [Spodoptera littoralis]